MERRHQIRYGLRVRVVFVWTVERGILQHGRGYTRDMSSKGMFVYADPQPPAKADIQIEAFFSSLVEIGSKLRMRAKARVVRVEPRGPGADAGFATQSRSYVLHNGVIDFEE